MAQIPGTQWNSNMWLYLPNYKEIFRSKVDTIMREKGQQVKYTDFNGIDLIHPGRHDAVDTFFKNYQIGSDAKIFEVGGGLGGSARHLHATRGVSIYGIEYLPHFVEASNELNALLGYSDKITLRTGDIANCEVPENEFDVALASVCFMYVQSVQGLMNVAKALKPGGLFYLEDYYFVKPHDQWDENDLHNIEARGMCGVRTKEEYYRIFEEMGMEVVEELEWGWYWSESAWQRAESILNEGVAQDTGIDSEYHQYVVVSPQLNCDVHHLGLEEIQRRYPSVCKVHNPEELVFNKQRLTSLWKVVLRKK